MKLAEALNARKELLNKMSSLSQKLSDNAIYQEGSQPVEDPQYLMQQLYGAGASLSELIKKINKTNAEVMVDGVPLGDLVVERDTKMRVVSGLRELVDSASSLSRRYSRSEILLIPSIDVKKVQKEIDERSKEIRELDNKIQATNWSTDLL